MHSTLREQSLCTGSVSVVSEIKDSAFVFVPEISIRLDHILNNIYKANPSITLNPQNFIYKSRQTTVH